MRPSDGIEIPQGINRNVRNARQATMLALLGNPRGSYDATCREVTNPRIRALLVYEDVGPFRVRGLAPAVESLRDILADVAREQPGVHAELGSAGMLCARLVRGSASSISNHSWGTAVDLTVEGVLDRRGDGRVQAGLARVAPVFNRHGWFWGAGFRTEDAMQFEAGDALVRLWHAQGRFGRGIAAPEPALGPGDRGPEVTALQERLNALGGGLEVDGVFGPATHAAVIAFQAREGLVADGVAGARTLAALGLA